MTIEPTAHNDGSSVSPTTETSSHGGAARRRILRGSLIGGSVLVTLRSGTAWALSATGCAQDFADGNGVPAAQLSDSCLTSLGLPTNLNDQQADASSTSVLNTDPTANTNSTVNDKQGFGRRRVLNINPTLHDKQNIKTKVTR